MKIHLKPKREESLLRFHPWVFSGAVKNMEGSPSDGDIVEVYSSQGKFLASGHYQAGGSIVVRVLSYSQQTVDRDFWKTKLQQAYTLRESIGLTENPKNNTYRLIHGEGDGMPGLIIDVYNQTAVMQAHTIGMYRLRHLLADLLIELYAGRLTAVYDKSENTLHAHEQPGNAYLFGQMSGDCTFTEYGNLFTADWEGGQKTGFFIDQRENRRLVEHYANGRTVLNMFGYTGAFSVYALRGGAKEVHTTDSSQRAIETAGRNVALNFPDCSSHKGIVSDCFAFFKDREPIYDMMIVDPPAFAKSRHALKNALQAYRRLNASALKAIRPEGIYFTFSCSQTVSREQFRSAVFAAALDADRRVRIIHQLTQPADHPVNMFHPEGEYLKGLVLFVE